ncbi:Ldh family oxidoreductase [Peteryoungia desertarenae]|uniref:Ldh family oxidoreductase n=1 Tax=Peteryoungia desertarenae TaxID=1813451 RepID=A0ABX6QQQ9_9HYPH|nr:Ldh family oxidoreductase [Peteryoungia desertarenae]QLF70545.1 Ldh family oxidoreductase [Peteryoungia desertarenae]
MSGLSERSAKRAGIVQLDRFIRTVLDAVGVDAASRDAATRAMLHGSRLGVDSHGVRLLDHYVSVFEGGRVNKAPRPTFRRTFAGVGRLDADNGHGALGAYLGMQHAIALAEEAGIGAVSVCNSSHFGPAGAFALEAAEKGYIGITFCNSDSFVRLHGGAERFHGTNPIAMAVPISQQDPWLFDMATSAIPYNRVKLYQSLGKPLPEATASDGYGRDTSDASLVEMLAPLGGEFGFKGAGLAGMVEIFSAVLSGMKLSHEILPMGGTDKHTPRQMGAFTLAIRPDAVVDRKIFDEGMRRYVEALRNSAVREGAEVMAPGDREWTVARERDVAGVPIDPDTQAAFERLAQRHAVELPWNA